MLRRSIRRAPSGPSLRRLLWGLPLLAACGARSEMESGSRGVGGGGGHGLAGGSVTGSGGSPASTGATGGGASSSSGAAGASSSSSGAGAGGQDAGPVCALEVIPPLGFLDGAPDGPSESPSLATSTDDGSQVTVFGAQSVDQASPNASLVYGSLFPWLSWPASGAIGESVAPGPTMGASKEILAAPLAGNRFAVLWQESAALWYSFGGSGQGFSLGEVIYGGLSRPLFAAPNPKGHLVGFQFPIDSPLGLDGLGIGTMDDGVYSGTAVVGCGVSIAASAIAWGADWLLATAMSQPLGSCDLDRIGPPTHVQVTRLSGGAPVEVEAAWDESTPLGSLELVPRSGGAWMVWDYAGATSTPIFARTIDGSGVPAPESLPVTAAGETAIAGSLAVDRLGDALLVAWHAPGGSIVVRVIDGGGAVLLSAVVPIDGSAKGAVSVIGAPSGDAILVAWAEVPPNQAAARIRIAKLACSGG